MSLPALIAGFVLAFAIGVACRLGRVPLPAPTRPLGAWLVVMLTLGYVSAGYWPGG